MDKLIDKIRLVKSGDDAVMMEIIEKFLPLIGKYTRKLNYDEDCKSELILKLIALVKNAQIAIASCNSFQKGNKSK